MLPVTVAIVGLLAILVFSYRDAYPHGGGAYAISHLARRDVSAALPEDRRQHEEFLGDWPAGPQLCDPLPGPLRLGQRVRQRCLGLGRLAAQRHHQPDEHK